MRKTGVLAVAFTLFHSGLQLSRGLRVSSGLSQTFIFVRNTYVYQIDSGAVERGRTRV